MGEREVFTRKLMGQTVVIGGSDAAMWPLFRSFLDSDETLASWSQKSGVSAQRIQQAWARPGRMKLTDAAALAHGLDRAWDVQINKADPAP